MTDKQHMFAWIRQLGSEGSQIEVLSQIIALQQEVVTSTLPLNQLMELICEKTQALTNAIGAVVEMTEGDEMVYRACSGSLIGSVGTRMAISTSLSGRSVLDNEVLYCEDVETDPRVNIEAARKIGAKSMICVPLTHKDHTVGVLKVVSDKVHAFSEREISILRLIAGVLSATIAHVAESDEKNIALASLRESELKFRTLIETAYEAILVSTNGLVIDANPALCKLFGYELKELLNRPIVNCVVQEDREMTINHIRQAYDKPYEVRALKKDGTSFIIEVTAKTVDLNNQKIRVSTIRDITAKKKAEEALRQSELKSREAAQLKSEFLANMSHEIRTPINGVMGMAGMLLDTPLNEQQKKYVEIIQNSADSLLSLVNDILDFSKIEANKMSLENIDFELQQVVEDIRQLMSISAEKKGLTFTCHVAEDLPYYLKGDPTRLRQVLSNLANNAIKFTERGSVVIKVSKIQSRGAKTQIRFEVTDTGIGIPESAMDSMFKPFSQVDASTTRRFGGTGLGLSICKQLVSMMGGDIGVKSLEGLGSTFWFMLDFEIAQTKHNKETDNVQQLAYPPQKLRVLVAEDNSVNKMIATSMIQKMGYTATAVANGKEAVDALEMAPYDLILMDCQMPEMDGYEATQVIRKSTQPWNQIPIVAMTANAMAGDREKCLEHGMNDYITKPMKYEHLVAVIVRVLLSARKSA